MNSHGRHAKPWNELCEACHSTIFSYGLTLSHKLDALFNKTKKIAASSKDVVGVSRSGLFNSFLSYIQ
jgi:L-rhamnose mutarotase